MSIQVNDFRWEPGKNDAEYIRLLESSRNEWQKIAQKAIAKLKMLSKVQKSVVHGQWINILDKHEWDQKMCSVCGDYFCCQVNYCPNCGAKMDGKRRDDDAAD